MSDPVYGNIGEIREELDPPRTLQCVLALPGSGLWAYWTSSTQRVVVVDTIFNPKAVHFAGKLDKLFTSEYPAEIWIVTKGWEPPPPEKKIYIEDEDHDLPRMERRDPPPKSET